MNESLDSLIEACKQYSKHHEGPNTFYPTIFHYSVVRYLKLVKRSAIFSYNEQKEKIEWIVVDNSTISPKTP